MFYILHVLNGSTSSVFWYAEATLPVYSSSALCRNGSSRRRNIEYLKVLIVLFGLSYTGVIVTLDQTLVMGDPKLYDYAVVGPQSR